MGVRRLKAGTRKRPPFRAWGVRGANLGGREVRKGPEEGSGQPGLEGFRDRVVGWPDTP